MECSKSGRIIVILLCLPVILFSFGKKETGQDESAAVLTIKEQPQPTEPIQDQTAGGYQSVPLDSPRVIQAEVLLKAKLIEDNIDLNSFKLLRAEEQVIAGYRIKLNYQLTPEKNDTAWVVFPIEGEPILTLSE